MLEELERDERVLVMGEDVGHFGGPFKVTKGFYEKFGRERVIDCPISESAIIGFATGAAMAGLRPIVEMQFIDFVTCGFNQLVNFAAKARYRWGQGVPLVVRGPSGAGNRAGPFHSLTPEMWFAHTAGLKVVCPATPYDAKGLIKAAVRDPDPVVYLEHKYLYRRIKDEVPADDYIVPIGKGRVVKEGKDISVITYGMMLHRCLEANQRLAQDGIDVEIIDLRTINPLDEELIIDSVRKTGKAVVVHEDVRMGGVGGEVIARICARAWEFLDSPPIRVTSADTPVPQSPPLEDAYLPSVEQIYDAVKTMARF